MLMDHATIRNQTFSTNQEIKTTTKTTISRNLPLTIRKEAIKPNKAILKVRRQIVAKAKAHVGRFEIQVVERVEEKVVQPVGHKAEKPVNGKALSRS
ncbi:hypothetical protein F2Q69_00012427 [Brassica cretica]|uniref:Uncharacterized protein n=1 Tax=Brassica cretica TaxID=69181 RepID=A0A8S9QX16_BRACR|nr:hypothetical protein F2Q69_00012427 [Brassica cretica]